jgi:membrane-associated protease RseP (regulator of RpoE activity)
MSDFYHKFRAEVAAGGAVDETVSPMATRNGKVTGIIMIALLAYLAVKNPWTFVFVVGLLLSVFLHEVGHFSTARLTGMKVTQFFMGFGPRVWSRSKGEVEFGVRALPLGAFVRIIGMNNVDEVDPADESRAYRSQTFPRRLLVITAGSLMHMVIAFALFCIHLVVVNKTLAFQLFVVSPSQVVLRHRLALWSATQLCLSVE